MALQLNRENIVKVCKDEDQCLYWAERVSACVKDSKNPSEYEDLILIGKYVTL